MCSKAKNMDRMMIKRKRSNTWRGSASNLIRVRNMKARSTLPASWRYCLRLLSWKRRSRRSRSRRRLASPALGTPAKVDFSSTQASTATSITPPQRARFLTWESRRRSRSTSRSRSKRKSRSRSKRKSRNRSKRKSRSRSKRKSRSRII